MTTTNNHDYHDAIFVERNNFNLMLHETFTSTSATPLRWAF